MTDEKKEDQFQEYESKIQLTMLRASFRFKEIPENELVDYTAFLIGNDKPLTSEQVRAFQVSQNFLFVGTSIFRSVDFALKLAKEHQVTPKIIIVDNSKQVHITWIKLKDFFFRSTETRVEEFLHDDEDGLLEFILNELHDETHGMNPVRFFSELFREFGVKAIKDLVIDALILRQDWGNGALFRDIKTLYSDRPIVAYPSNIISCCDQEGQCSVLTAIDILQPDICIYSNLDAKERVPTKTHILTQPTSLLIAKSLALSQETIAALPSSSESPPPPNDSNSVKPPNQ